MKTIKIILFLLFANNVKTNAQCWQSFSSGGGTGLSVTTEGKLYYWGSGYPVTNLPTQIGNDSNWETVFGGFQHNFALKTDGTLWAWGENNYGQLGDGTLINKSIPIQIGIDTNWQTISACAGGFYTLALKIDGTLWAWGQNQFGQLGDGTLINKSIPIQIGIDTNWQTIIAGGGNSLALKNDGTLWTWGYNGFGQLGDGTLVNKSVPTQIGTATNWLSISSAHSHHALALKSDGTLWAWGYNNAGQVGNGVNNFIPVTLPTQVGIDNNWQKIATGRFSSYALKQNGALYHFGSNITGQGANGTTQPTAINLPNQVGLDTNWVDMKAGVEFILALKSNGDLYSWGYNQLGQLGNGNNTSQYSPVIVSTCTLSSSNYQQNNITIYPNPTKHTLNISATVPLQKTIMYNIVGTKVIEQKFTESIDVSDLASGLYIIKLYNEDNAVFVQKIVKE